MSDGIPTPVFGSFEEAIAWLDDYQISIGYSDPACSCQYFSGEIRPSRLPDGTERFFVVIPLRSTTIGCERHAPLTFTERRPRWALWRKPTKRKLTSDEALGLIFGGRKP